jgi:hypothetical protein
MIVFHHKFILSLRRSLLLLLLLLLLFSQRPVTKKGEIAVRDGNGWRIVPATDSAARLRAVLEQDPDSCGTPLGTENR